MSKRRKYDIKNKRSFIIIVILSIAVIGIFSLFIYKYAKASRVEYIIEAETVLQDVEKNYITLDEDAVLKVRWDGTYYLSYKDERITLGKKVITYNAITGGMKLYGTFYEIESDGKIIEYKNETVLANTTNAKFYKLDDREYLLVDTKISSSDNSIEAYNYLLVELDKAGNAKLSNNKLNLKTISPTILVTSKYRFDIANEILNFGELDIDLKKIIGSTNQYVPEVEEDDSDDDTSSNENNNNVVNNSQSGGMGAENTVRPGDVINTTNPGDVTDIEDIMDKLKMTSIVRIVEGITQIDVDYVIYDPYGEYHSVEIEIMSDGVLIGEPVPLDKGDTHITLDGLKANTKYKLNFVYKISKLNEESQRLEDVTNTFATFDLKTKMPEYGVSIYKVSKSENKLTLNVDLQNGYDITKISGYVYFDNEEIEPIPWEYEIKDGDMNRGYVRPWVSIPEIGITSKTIVTLTIDEIETTDGNGTLVIDSAYNFRFGGE